MKSCENILRVKAPRVTVFVAFAGRLTSVMKNTLKNVVVSELLARYADLDIPLSDQERKDLRSLMRSLQPDMISLSRFTQRYRDVTVSLRGDNNTVVVHGNRWTTGPLPIANVLMVDLTQEHDTDADDTTPDTSEDTP